MARLAGNFVQVLVDGYELSGDSQTVSIRNQRDTYDVASLEDEVHPYIVGKHKLEVEHAGYLNAASARSHPVLKAVAIQGAISVLLGNNAPAALGDPVFSLITQQTHYTSQAVAGGAVPFRALFANRGAWGSWGKVLLPPTTINAPYAGSGMDHGASTTNGGTAFLHILSASTDAYTLKVEGSNASNFSTIDLSVTFTLNGMSLGSQRVDLPSSTVPQYLRANALTGTSPLRLAMTLVRF